MITPSNHQNYQLISKPHLPNQIQVMSCCNGKCGCGSSCSCGSGCKGCGMYPDIETSTTATMIVDGVAPKKMYDDGSDVSFVSEGGHACKCGANCKCNPCNC